MALSDAQKPVIETVRPCPCPCPQMHMILRPSAAMYVRQQPLSKTHNLEGGCTMAGQDAPDGLPDMPRPD